MRSDDPREVTGYRLLARIGEGGMGTVYLSRTRGNQPVALKVIRREYAQDEEFRRRFEQEARSARQVQGYHLVPVVDHDTTGAVPWLATAFVPAVPLDVALATYGPLPLPTVLQLMGCAAEALRAVHAAGVIHRDLKPSNILLGTQGPSVIDFGIARAADATQLTRSGGLIGTPQFMSPEHADGQPLGPATDVFSLGLVAAVAATGRHPYGDGGAITLATKIANTELRPPSLSGYPEPLQGILEQCLSADPAARPTPGELAEVCERASGRRLQDFTGWLPEPIAAEIARRERAAEHPPAPAYASTATGLGAPTAPPTTHPPRHATAAPTPPPAPMSPSAPARRRTGLTALAVLVAVAVTAGVTWSLTRPDGKGTDGAKGGTASSPAPGASKSAAAKAGGKATYTAVFKNKAFTLRAPQDFAYTRIDLDVPKADPLSDWQGVSENPPEIELKYSHWSGVSELKFLTTTGKSTGTTPEDCKSATETNALATEIQGKALTTDLTKGTVLCTVTSDGKLAMLKITDVVPHEVRPDYVTQLTLWTIS
ncbi:serine/threonine-protein kinase [Streptomyces sp. V4I2]|uniref:serine/threonine-protein kinase n=1 Tax=Streptomyces sp. V4I2 TaxID=3042280 RepID=UPI00278AE143|nr:serine/threonine-protein kinase [Streptomyces sp. V4I2]MDQ1045904.1 putative Ser/Thr protein kinase [Streptomyces sp. V4I2]